MKPSLVLLFLTLYTVYGSPTGENDRTMHEHVHAIGPFTSIRKTTKDLSTVGGRRSSSDDSRSDLQCAATCARQMKEKIHRDLPGHEQRAGATMMSGDSDTQRMGKLCGIYNGTKTCLNRCHTSQAKTTMIKGLGIGQYICDNFSFKQNAPCLYEAQKTVGGACGGQNKCGQYKTKMEEYKQNHPTNEEGLKQMLKNTCQFMKCASNCAKPTVISKCGQSAQNDFQTLIGKSAEFLKYTVESAGLSQAYPRECDQLTAN